MRLSKGPEEYYTLKSHSLRERCLTRADKEAIRI